MFPYWERLVCLLLARSLSHPSPRTPHSEVLNLGIIPLHQDIITNKKNTNKLADIGKNHYLCSKNRLPNLPIDRKMEYISVIQFAEKYGISERTTRN